MASPRIAVVGAGSFVFGASLLLEALETLRLDGLEFRLIDPQLEAAEAMAALARGVARRNSLSVRVSTHASFEEPAALEGADFVLHTAAPQLARRYSMDCDILERSCPDEAMLEFGGVAGISYSLRQIHLVEKLADRMKAHCPSAWLLCAANPLPRVCQAAHESGIRTIGLCAAWMEGFTFLSGLLTGTPEPHPWKTSRARWKFHFGGLNHFTWVGAIEDAATGADALPELLARLGAGHGYGQPQCEAFTLRHRAWLLPNDHHVRDFLPVDRPTHRREFPMHGTTGERERAFRLLRGAADGTVPLHEAVPHPSWEHPAHVIAGLALGHSLDLDSLNLPNSDGQLPGLPENVFVETAVRCEGGRLIPARFELPDSVLPLCQRTARLTGAIVAAARSRSLAGLREACALDPTIRQPEAAFTALQACLQAHADLIPTHEYH